MPFARNRGQRIHYTVDGSGSLVILQHGLLMDADSWTQSGIVDALADGFRVACVDSLGHGLSDKPSDPELYVQEQRSGDIVAVIDDLGYDRAHLVGYSMGGWLSVGAVKHYPKRLSSVILGGWDPASSGTQRASEFRLFHAVGQENGANAGRMDHPGVRARRARLFRSTQSAPRSP